MIVYVVTDVESGWDCVRGVFSTKEKAIDYCKEREGVGEDGEWVKDTSSLIIHNSTLDR